MNPPHVPNKRPPCEYPPSPSKKHKQQVITNVNGNTTNTKGFNNYYVVPLVSLKERPMKDEASTTTHTTPTNITPTSSIIGSNTTDSNSNNRTGSFSGDLVFPEHLYSSPPFSPDGTFPSSPRTPPTPIVHHSDDENDDSIMSNDYEEEQQHNSKQYKTPPNAKISTTANSTMPQNNNGGKKKVHIQCNFATPATPTTESNQSSCNFITPTDDNNTSNNTSYTSDTSYISNASSNNASQNSSFATPTAEDNNTSNNGFLIKSNLKSKRKNLFPAIATMPRFMGQHSPLMRRRSSSLTSLINPFTPEGRALKEAKQAHNPSYRKMLEEATLPKNWELLVNTPSTSGSTYKLLFEQLEVIGKGTFGEVTKCRHKVDGCVYAVKRTIRQLRGKRDRQLVLREVYGLAAIQDHAHIVRYYTAWEEENRIFIQAEWCEGGTLQSWVDACVEPTEAQLLTVLRHIALGLSHIHSQNLVHLDIKPENMYIKYTVSGDVTSAPIFKIGDLGLLNEASNSKLFMEGDCRYLSRELLQDDMSCLRKSDIFSLGASVYELCRRSKLPRNGQEWGEIRDGILHIPSGYSAEFGELLQSMVDPSPLDRPSADDIVRHPLVMMVAKIPSVIEGQEGSVCGRGQDAFNQLTQQVTFLQQQLQQIQATLQNNPSNPQTFKPITANVQTGFQGMQLSA